MRQRLQTAMWDEQTLAKTVAEQIADVQLVLTGVGKSAEDVLS